VRASGWTVIAWSRLGSTASATIAEYGRALVGHRNESLRPRSPPCRSGDRHSDVPWSGGISVHIGLHAFEAPDAKAFRPSTARTRASLPMSAAKAVLKDSPNLALHDRSTDDCIPRGDVERALIRDARDWRAGSRGLAGCGTGCRAGTGSRDRQLGAHVPWVDAVEHSG
jgi:hypothetical protein